MYDILPVSNTPSHPPLVIQENVYLIFMSNSLFLLPQFKGIDIKSYMLARRSINLRNFLSFDAQILSPRYIRVKGDIDFKLTKKRDFAERAASLREFGVTLCVIAILISSGACCARARAQREH